MKNNVSPYVIVAAAVAVLAFLGYLIYTFAVPPQFTPSAASKATPPPGGNRDEYYKSRQPR